MISISPPPRPVGSIGPAHPGPNAFRSADSDADGAGLGPSVGAVVWVATRLAKTVSEPSSTTCTPLGEDRDVVRAGVEVAGVSVVGQRCGVLARFRVAGQKLPRRVGGLVAGVIVVERDSDAVTGGAADGGDERGYCDPVGLLTGRYRVCPLW
jgi:hypothetical protein